MNHPTVVQVIARAFGLLLSAPFTAVPITAVPLLAVPWVAAALSPAAGAQSMSGAHWIWGDDGGGGSSKPTVDPNEALLLSKSIALTGTPQRAFAWVTCDNHFRLVVNGSVAGRGDDWSRLQRFDLTHLLHAGDNTLIASCHNEGGPAAFVFALEVTRADGTKARVVSDTSWLAALLPDNIDATLLPTGAWKPAHDIGPFGMAPWGELQAPPAPTFDPLPGFALETVAEGFGSVVALAAAGPGRFLANVEGGPIFELLDADSDGRAEVVRPFTAAIKGCQGMFWQPGITWFTGAGPDGHGLYRLPDGATAPQKVVALDGDLGEHGPHAIVEGPDGWLYVAIGNHARLGQPPASTSPYRLTYEGHVLPTYVDPNGHATECKAPGGFILRVDPKGGTCELFAAGFRNHYDLAFDERGELFTFDSDMEWDVGLPWYRPVRIVHVVPGGEYGWRTGSSVWPNSAADSLPPTIEAGRGSPTGMCLCTGTQFPERFRGSILAADWSLGVIYAFRGTPRGTSYDMTADVLLRGHPLNVTDLAMDGDGSLLFATGGRGTVGGVHRLKWVGAPEPVVAQPDAAARAREVVAQLTKVPAAALVREFASPDRWRRFLAARELERRPEEERAQLLAKALDPATEPIAAAELLILEARTQSARDLATTAPPAVQKAGQPQTAARAAARLHRALDLFTQPGVEGELRHALLRALQLWRIAMQDAVKEPNASNTLIDGSKLLTGFPCTDLAANRDWAQLIAAFAPPGAAASLWRAFQQEPSREQRVAYANALRCVKEPWPEGAHVAFHRWLDDSIRANTGGMSYVGYLTHIRDDAAIGLSTEERATLDAEAAARLTASAATARPPASAAEPREFDRVLTFVERTLQAPHRSLPEGGLLFQELCSKCHKRGEYGTNVGPDLTTIGARFGPRDLIESMLAPSRTISDQYRGLNVFLKNGDVLTGMPLISDDKHVLLVDLTGKQVDIPATQIERRKPATKSVMPESLADGLSYEQFADLTAWLLAPTIVAPAKEAGWRPLLDARTLAAATASGAAWTLADGVLRGAPNGGSGSNGGGDGDGDGDRSATGAEWLIANPVGEFAVEFEARLSDKEQQLTFLFRTASGEAESGASYATDAGGSAWGRLREANGRGVIVQPRQEIWWPLPERSGWNHFLITAEGARITVRLNGTITVDTEDRGGRTEGALGFELPVGATAPVEIRQLRLRSSR
ncbi:MAG: DUF1080 domain-containing protein [Planctomycetes bacterium]|nr:DUF1080 domain-containing protein [Planctomycetota bacterium]